MWLRSASVLASLALSASAQTVWHVRANAPFGGDGLSWATPFRDLDTALALAQPGDQVWLTQGRYRPAHPSDPADPRSATFAVNQVELYGGFLGFEASPAQRQGSALRTVLTGDIGIGGQIADNAYTVVSVFGNGRLDGLRIQDGNSDASTDGVGGGVELYPLEDIATKVDIDGCLIRANRAANSGGGFFATFGVVNIMRTRFAANHATDGAGAYMRTVRLRMVNTTFEHNQASDRGGALFLGSISVNTAGTPNALLANTLFAQNTARLGGGVYVAGASNTAGAGGFYHCTFASNAASDTGGGLYAVTTTQTSATVLLFNSLLWGNTAPNAAPEIFGTPSVCTYCLVPLPGAGNFYADPQFAPGTFKQALGSPAIDAGASYLDPSDWVDIDGDGSVIEYLPIDLVGNYRLVGIDVDVGCYEF